MIPLRVDAQELPDFNITAEKQYSVAVFPQSIPIYLTKNIPPQMNPDVSVIRRALTDQIKAHPYLNLISFNEIDEKYKTADMRSSEAVMQAEIDMNYARNFISGMNYASAIDILQRVIQNYKKSQFQYYQPNVVAQAYQQLAYALISQYEEDPEKYYDLMHAARQAFVELIRLAPYLVMLEGRQSPERVARYDEALDIFLGNKAYRQTDPKEAASLARKIGADILLMPRLVQLGDGNFNLEMDVFNARTQSMDTIESYVALDLATSESVGENAAQMMSRIFDCLYVPLDAPPPETHPGNQFYAELGFSYSAFLKHPTAEILPNMGGHVFVSYLIERYLFVRMGFEVLAVVSDSSRELYDSFQVYQIPVQFGLLKIWDWFGLYVAIGASFSFSSPFAIARSTICKTFGRDDIECNNGVDESDAAFALQVDALTGMKFGKPPFYFVLEGTAALTAYPMLDNKSFRFPVGLRSGIEYWF